MKATQQMLNSRVVRFASVGSRERERESGRSVDVLRKLSFPSSFQVASGLTLYPDGTAAGTATKEAKELSLLFALSFSLSFPHSAVFSTLMQLIMKASFSFSFLRGKIRRLLSFLAIIVPGKPTRGEEVFNVMLVFPSSC